MPKTIIKVKTFMCPNGIGKLEETATENVCRFHRAWDNLPEDNKCPTCDLELVKATLDEDRMTMTVMGEEDIETEIEEELAEPGIKGIDVSTEAKKTAYRTRRKKDIADAIIEARKHED